MITTFILFLGSLFPDLHPHRSIMRRWLKIFNIKIVYLSRFSDHFSADIIENKLFVSRFNKAIHSRNEYLYSIAHELGHLFDFAQQEHFNTHKESISKKAIIEDEEAAWKIAEMLLTQTEDFNQKEYILFRDKNLQHYKDVLDVKRSKKPNKNNSRSRTNSKKKLKEK